MFTQASKMSPELRAHLRYPEDIFTEQAMMYGKYHITTASSFYSAADAWTLSPSPGAGSPSQALQTTFTTNAQGQQVSTGQLVRMAPLYQEMRIPGQVNQSFNLLDAFVPVSSQSQIQTLSGYMIAGSDPAHYGQLETFVTPRDNPVPGPAIVSAQIDSTPNVSKQITLLNSNGSSALLGNVLMIPVAQGLLYVQPLYVASSRNAIPSLQYIIAVNGKQPAAIGGTLADALTALGVRSGLDHTGKLFGRVALTSGSTTLGCRPERLPAIPIRSPRREPRGVPDRHQRPRTGPSGGAAVDWLTDPVGAEPHHDDDQPEWLTHLRATTSSGSPGGSGW